MSTRSYIGYLNDDGSVTGIYCHFDGYLEGVGRTLYNHYTTDEKVKALVALGGISVLGERLEFKQDPKYSPKEYITPENGYTMAYARDWGEQLEIEHFSKPKQFEPDGMIEYSYLWVNNHWEVSFGHGFAPLIKEMFEG